MASRTNNPQEFLNSLKHDEVSDFVTALLPLGYYLDLVNYRHVQSTNIDDLATMKSLRPPHDGAFFTKWMQCKIQPHHLDQQPEAHPNINLQLNAKNAWPESVQDRFNKFAVSKKIKQLTIYAHHIVLLSISDGRLPLLAAKENHDQASHLCDTNGCLSEEHLCIEQQQVNRSRTTCEGITLHIFGNTAADFIIFQADPCEHGLKHTKANGDFFKYSCRKIRVEYSNKNDCR